MTETESAYVAGIIDGEGSIGLTWRKSSYRGKKILRVQLQIGMCNEEVIAYISKLFGQAFCESVTCDGRPRWSINVGGMQTIKDIMSTVYKYLIVKRPQADVMLEYIDSRQARTSSKTYTDHELGCYERLRKLNLRGTIERD